MNTPLAPTPLTPGARSMDEEAAALQKSGKRPKSPLFCPWEHRGRNLFITPAERNSCSIGTPVNIRR